MHGIHRRLGTRALLAGITTIGLVATTFAGAAPAGASSTRYSYNGGAILDHVKVVPVLYGAPTGPSDYLPQIVAPHAPNVSNFFSNLTKSSVMDMLSEYSTPTQALRHGTVLTGSGPGGLFVITPSWGSPPVVPQSVDDAALRADLQANVGSALPAADSDTLFVVFFRHGQKLTIASAGVSSDLFCAYHNSIAGSPFIRYVAVPGRASDTGCGKAGGFANVTATITHEFAESVTDPDPGHSWSNYGDEIGNPCNHMQKSFTGADKQKYTVQTVWSNQQQACVLTGPSRYIGVGDASVIEGDSGTHMLQIPVTLTAASMTPVAVTYTMTGLGGGSGIVPFTPNGKKGTPLVQMISVPIAGDTTSEVNESFSVTIAAGAGYGVVRATASGTIVDDDPNSGVRISVGDASAIVPETANGTIAVPVTLSSPSSSATTVKWMIAGSGTLITGAKAGILTIPAGATGGVVNVTTKATKKALFAADKTVTVTLSLPSAGVALGDAHGVATLLAP